MVSIEYNGGLGNKFFQYVAAYIFAKKFNLNIQTSPTYNSFNLPILEGDKYEDEIIDVDDNNFLVLLKSEKLKNAHYKFIGFYQIKEFILDYRDEIKSIFELKYDDVDKNLVFVIYRIGDIVGTMNMLPIEYYIEMLKALKCKGGYITSDTLNHKNILYLSHMFNLEIYDNDANGTIDFAKNFNNLILSEGTFSWWIGFLSNAKNIIYNERPRFWHGDIFVLPEWKGVKFFN